MLKLVIAEQELYDDSANRFIYTPTTVLELEHSLISISKWEAMYHKPFLSQEKKSKKEIMDYSKCMTINNCNDNNVYLALSDANIKKITAYIEDSMTATWFNESPNERKSSREQVTSELIYYWMVALNIPFECQKWHLNRLLTLIRICNIKNAPPKKMSQREIMSRNSALNAARRKALGTKG